MHVVNAFKLGHKYRQHQMFPPATTKINWCSCTIVVAGPIPLDITHQYFIFLSCCFFLLDNSDNTTNNWLLTRNEIKLQFSAEVRLSPQCDRMWQKCFINIHNNSTLHNPHSSLHCTLTPDQSWDVVCVFRTSIAPHDSYALSRKDLLLLGNILFSTNNRFPFHFKPD